MFSPSVRPVRIRTLELTSKVTFEACNLEHGPSFAAKYVDLGGGVECAAQSKAFAQTSHFKESEHKIASVASTQVCMQS